MFVCPHMFVHPQGCTHPHMPPILICASVCSQRLCMLWGSCKGLPFVLGHLPYNTPIWGCLPFNYTPTLSCWFPVHQYVSGISVCYVGIFPSVEVFGGVPPINWGFRGHQHLRCPYPHSGTFFVVHYVSPSTTAPTATPLVTVVSSGLSSVLSVTVASFPAWISMAWFHHHP